MNEDSIFAHVLQKESPHERAAYLDAVCAGDKALRSRLDALLASHDKQDSLLDEPLVTTTTDRPAALERPGTKIGRYKLLQKIGEGGFGAVYMAEQNEPVQRRVALKIIKPGMDSRQVIARFEAERQALAMMDHPNIAKVFDAGTTDSGRPYFVMELVHGVPITQFCDDGRLSPRARLKLFIPVCHAIQHAHQKGIIHRDIKPSNILVCLYDGAPVTKVIDFGVAKAIQQRLTNKTMFTQFGQVIGTLEYMSPEQAELNQYDVDTRTDVYSLGAVLYELLTGATPFDREKLRAAAFDEMLRIIREEEPLRPSQRLSSSRQLAAISAQRRSEPAKLSGNVQGELDWIVMKALEKQRSRRYETAIGLAQDVKRFLNDEAVEAGPPSAAYRASKFVRKHSRPLAVAVAFILILLAATVASSVQSMRATASAKSAREARDRAEADRKRADNNFLEATAMRLAAQSEMLREERPIRSLLLAVESVNISRAHALPVMPSARAALLQALDHVGGQPLVGHTDYVTQIRISSDGTWLATASLDGSVMLWDLKQPDPSNNGQKLGATAPVTGLAMSPDNKWLACRSKDGMVHIWDLTASDVNKPAMQFDGSAGVSRAIVFSHDSRRLAVACEDDRSVRLWDLSATNPAATVAVLNDAVRTWAHTVFFCPNGKWLYTGDVVTDAVNSETGKNYAEYSARLWDITAPDIATSSVELPWHGAGSHVSSSPDGRWLTTSSGDSIEIRDMSAIDPMAVVRAIEYGLSTQNVWSSDGRWFAFVTGRMGFEQRLHLCDMSEDDMPVKPVHHVADRILLCSISPSGRWLITAIDDQPYLFDLDSADPSASPIVFPRHGEGMFGLLSPNDRWLVTSTRVNDVRVWDLQLPNSSSFPNQLQAHEVGLSRPAAISPDSRWLVTTAGDYQRREPVPRLWDLSRESLMTSTTVVPNAVDFAGDRYLLSVLTPDGTVVRRIDLLDGSYVDLDVQESAFQWARLTSDGRWLLASGTDIAAVWDLSATPPRQVFNIVEAGYSGFRVSRSGRWLCAQVQDKANDSRFVRIWDLRSSDISKSMTTLPENAGGTRFPAFRRFPAMGGNDRWLLVFEDEDVFEFWECQAPQPVLSRRFSHEERIIHAKLFSDGKWFASITEGGMLRVWDLESEQLNILAETALRPRPTRILDISSDGRWLAVKSDLSAGDHVMVLIWDLQNPTTLQCSIETNPDDEDVWHARFNKSGNLIATGSGDRVVRLWEVASQNEEPILTLPIRSMSFHDIHFTIGDERLVCVGKSGISHIWDLNVERTLRDATERAGRGLSLAERRTYRLPDPSESDTN